MTALLPNQQRIGPLELFRQGGDARFAKAAAKDGERRRSLSVLFEELDPTSEHSGPDAKLDAYGRVLKAAGIRTKSDPAQGYWADPIDKFYDTSEARALFPEFIRRKWMEARTGRPANPHADAGTRAVTSLDDGALGSVLRPYVDLDGERQGILEADVSVAAITALEQPIDGASYRSIYLSDPIAADVRMTRVAERAEIPMAVVAMGARENHLFKYARGFEISDEARRRGRIDKLGLFLQQVAVQNEGDKFAHAIDVLVNGDGNPGTSATEFDLTALDTAAVAGTLTLAAWIAWVNKFRKGFILDTIVGREAEITKLLLLTTGSANIPVAVAYGGSFGTFTPLNPRLAGARRYAISDEAPTGKLIGLDSRQALEHATEIGSSVRETERFATKQVEVFLMSEVEGYGVFDPRATKLLDRMQ